MCRRFHGEGEGRGMPPGHLAKKEQNPSPQSMESGKLENTELVRKRKGGTSSAGNPIAGKHIEASHTGFSPSQIDSTRKVVQKTYIWASLVLLLTELLFPFSS